MLKRRKKRHDNGGEMGGQDSFLDIVSNIVGILIILVMIAGVKAQNSLPFLSELEEEPVKVQYADRETLESIEARYVNVLEKERTAMQARHEIEVMKDDIDIYDEQISFQAGQHAELFDLLTSARAAIELVAGEKDQATKEKIETQRQLQETEAKLQQIHHTKQWLAANRPKATILENIPTPISKTVEEGEKEAHFRLLGGRISYVPIPEFSEALYLEFAQNREKYLKQKMSDGRLAPIDDWFCRFLLVSYDVPVRGPYGGGVATQVAIDVVEFLPVREPAGQPLKEAIASSQSDLMKKLRYFRQDIYTITFWVYPDSYEEYREINKVLQAQGYRVAARPMEFGQNIRGSQHGTKSSAQ